MTVAGDGDVLHRAGTAVLQTYPCHLVLQANRAVSVAAAMGRPGLTLGIGPSHESVQRRVSTDESGKLRMTAPGAWLQGSSGVGTDLLSRPTGRCDRQPRRANVPS
jgi:hypothetical protein